MKVTDALKNKRCITKYNTHEAEISNIKHNESESTLSFNLFYDVWIREQHEKDGLYFSRVRVDTKCDLMKQKRKPEHWHVDNPSKTNKYNKYLDKWGQPTREDDPNAHMNNDEIAELLEQLGGSSC